MSESENSVQTEVPGKPGLKRTPTTETQKARRRALAKVLAYTLVALPGAYSAVRSQYQAETETVAKVNREKAGQIVKLQEWVKANKAEAQAARNDVAELRKELANDRREFTKLLVQIARRSNRTFRHVRHPDEPPPTPTRRRLTEPAAKVQKEIDKLSAPPKVKSSGRVTLPRPKLEKPAASLEQVQRMN